MNGSRVFMRSAAIRHGLPIVLGLFVLVSAIRLVFPARERTHLKQRLATAAQQRGAMETLYPLYVEMCGMDRMEDWSALALPERVPLNEESVRSASDIFNRLAVAHDMEVDKALFTVVDEGGRRALQVDLTLRGLYRQLGALLVELIRLPSLEAVVRVSAARGDDLAQIHLELRLGLE